MVVTASVGKSRGSVALNLQWTGVAIGELFRDGSSLGTVSGGSYQDQLGKRANGGHSYYLCLPEGGVCSDTVEVFY